MKKSDIQFVFVGNSLAVDFTNTEIISRGELVELLQEGADLVRWAQAAGLALDQRINESDFVATLTLRQALKELFLARIDRLAAPRKALNILNQHLADHATHQVLRYDRQSAVYELVLSDDTLSVQGLLANLAYEAAVLLASPQAEYLKHCSNTDCVLIFMDTSRGHKRRWCSMDTCGNRAKVATHYRNSLSQ